MSNIYQTEASLTKDVSGNTIGIITKLAGAVDNSIIKLYLNNPDFRKFEINFIPTLNIELRVYKSYNAFIFEAQKNISPLKKGETIVFYFEDGTYFEKKFTTGRIDNGKFVKNLCSISNIQFLQLIETKLSHIKIRGGLEITYDFINIKNNQYSNVSEGRELFRIICERLAGIKRLIINPESFKEQPINSNGENQFLL